MRERVKRSPMLATLALIAGLMALGPVAQAEPAVTGAAPAGLETLSEAEMVAALEQIDRRQRAVGDYKARVFIKQSEEGKQDIVYEAVIYRRDADDKLLLLFLAPKSEAGKGYLRIDDNLWLYSPATGKWERRTERERIAGTDSRRADFDESRLAEEYTPSFLGVGKLGKFATYQLELRAKEGADVAWPVVRLDVDQRSGNILKRQEFALSGRLMRTSYFPKWHRVKSPDKGELLWYPKDMRIFDEVDKANKTAVRVERVDLSRLDKNIFTKAWLEAQSR